MNMDKFLAVGRNFVSYLMGVATLFGVAKVQGIDLSVVSSSMDHIFNGVKEIAIGLGPLITIAMGWWATRKPSAASSIAAVTALPGRPQIIVSPAVPVDSPLAIAAADPNQPQVKLAGSR
jgi:hypothetical protein